MADTAQALRCTYCGGAEFYGGPEAGSAQNVLCANPDCRHWFNDILGMRLEDLHRVEPTADEREQKIQDQQAANRRFYLEMMEEGAKLYESGESPLSILIDREGHSEAKMIGFMAAMQTDLAELKQ